MRVLVCVKRVPAPGARISITADGQAVDTAYLAFTTSPHEECAVEEAVQLVERHGGESTVLTLGPAEADEQLRYAASIGVNLVLFGNESADAGNFQIGVRVAYALGRPVVNGIKGIEVEGDALRARRESDAGVEVYRVPLPAVLGVKEGINLPRYPTLKGRLASKKVEVVQIPPHAEPGGQQMVTLLQAAEQVSQTAILGNGPDAASAVVDLLEELGLLK